MFHVSEVDTSSACQAVQARAVGTGMHIALTVAPSMLHFFKAGSDVVKWDLTQIERDGSCRLAVHHARGTIIEYFRTGAMAVRRVQEIEELLIRARTYAPCNERAPS